MISTVLRALLVACLALSSAMPQGSMQYRLNAAVHQRLLKAPRVALEVCDSWNVNKCEKSKSEAHEVISDTIFRSKRCVVFSISEDFDPAYCRSQISEFEKHYDAMKMYGVDDVYCILVGSASRLRPIITEKVGLYCCLISMQSRNEGVTHAGFEWKPCGMQSQQDQIHV